MTGPDRWQTVRGLFDAVCDLPEARWRPALGELCDDPAAIDETLHLLRAQTTDLGRAEHEVQRNAGTPAGRGDAQLSRASGPQCAGHPQADRCGHR